MLNKESKIALWVALGILVAIIFSIVTVVLVRQNKIAFHKTLEQCFLSDDLECLQAYHSNISLETLAGLSFGINDVPLLHFLLENSSFKIMNYLLNKGFHTDHVDKFGYNALYSTACQSGRSANVDLVEATKILIDHGFDINQENNYGENVLWAQLYGKTGDQCVKRFICFLENGAKPILGKKSILLGKKSILSTFLSSPYGAKSELWQPFINILELLLKKGVNADNSALFIFLQHPPIGDDDDKFYTKELFIDCIKLILSQNPDLTAKNEYGKTVLEVAQMYSNDLEKKDNKDIFLDFIKLIKEHQEKEMPSHSNKDGTANEEVHLSQFNNEVQHCLM